MGPNAPARTRRLTVGALLVTGLLTLSGCSTDQVKHYLVLFLPDPISTEGHYVADLWDGMWLTAWITGVIVWGLMLYVSVRYHRKDEDHVPVQMRYHLPIEIFYTIVPVLMVMVIFFFTVKHQDALAADDNLPPDATITVVGQKWAWTFNYMKDDATGGQTVYETGTPAHFPTLYLPVDERVRFELRSADVIHSFWVPGFLYKMDVVPGRNNGFALTPNRKGTFAGKCAELCGTYHSRMLFNVKVVSPQEYAAHLKKLQQQGNTGLAEGSGYVTTVPGLGSTHGGNK